MSAPTEYLIQLNESAEGWAMKLQHYTPGAGIMAEKYHERTQRTYPSPEDAITSARHLVREVVTAREGKAKR